jgi:hypothetical protein
VGLARGNYFPQALTKCIALPTDSIQTKAKKKGKKAGKGPATSKNDPTSGAGTGVDTALAASKTAVTKRHQAPQVEEADD